MNKELFYGSSISLFDFAQSDRIPLTWNSAGVCKKA